MPEIVKCPDCNRSLRVPDDLLGKIVRCPSCQVTFKAQAGDPEPRPAPKRQLDPPDAPPTPRKSLRREEQIEGRPSRRRRDDDEDDRPPRHEEEFGDDDEMEEVAERRGRRSPRGSRAEWTRVKQGLGYLLAAVFVILGSILLVFCGAFVLGAAIGAGAAGRNAGGPDAVAMGGGFLAIMGLYLVGFLAFVVLHVIGLIYGLAAPEYRSARTLAKVCLGLFVLYLAAQLVNIGLALIDAGLGGVNPMALGGNTGFRLVISLAGSGALVGHTGVLIFYFRSLALALRENGLVSNAMYFFIFYIAFMVFAVIGTIVLVASVARGVGAAAGGQGGGGLAAAGGLVIAVGCILFLLSVGLVIWYIITLVMTRTAIGRATRH